MLKPLDICIASRAFASLILDYEYDASDDTPAYCGCRVLIEDLYAGWIVGSSREECIAIFNKGGWNK